MMLEAYWPVDCECNAEWIVYFYHRPNDLAGSGERDTKGTYG